jgi:hypothetical protein
MNHSLELNGEELNAVLGAISIAQYLTHESYVKYGEPGLLESMELLNQSEESIRQQTGLN